MKRTPKKTPPTKKKKKEFLNCPQETYRTNTEKHYRNDYIFLSGKIKH